MAISRFNLHALVDQEEEDDEVGVVELVRVEPPLAHLLPDPPVLFARFPGHEPSFPRSVYPIQDIPFIRCSTSRSCQGCNHGACTKNEPPCDACKCPRSRAFCLHLSPCLKWPPDMQERYRAHQRFLQEKQEKERQKEAAGGQPPAAASLLEPSHPGPLKMELLNLEKMVTNWVPSSTRWTQLRPRPARPQQQIPGTPQNPD